MALSTSVNIFFLISFVAFIVTLKPLQGLSLDAY